MGATHVIFKKGLMMSENNDSYLRIGKAHADLDNGNVVALSGLVSGEDDLWTTAAVSDVTAEEVFIVDGDSSKILVDGKWAIDLNDIREFYTPSGKRVRLRKLAHGDSCYVSAAAFASTPTVGQYAVPANAALTLAPAANLSGGTLVAFKVIKAHTFYVGGTSVAGYRLECVVSK